MKIDREQFGVLYYLERVTSAKSPAEVLVAIQDYLAAWPKERVERLQKVDGGWGPFDTSQRATDINGVRDLRRIRTDIQRQCGALRAAGLQPNAELAELDEIVLVATQAAEAFKFPGFQPPSPAETGRSRLANPN